MCMGLICLTARSEIKTTGSENSITYGNISKRNLFGLKDPAPVPAATNPPTVLPKLSLTGITTILGRKQALIRAQLLAEAGQPAREESYVLTEGQRDGKLEVLQIDEKAGNVSVNNSGTVLTLNIDRDSPKLVSAPAATAAPGAQLAPGIPRPTGGTNASVYAPGTTAIQHTLPTRTYHPPGLNATSASNGTAVAAPATSGLPAVPPPAVTAPEAELTPEAQTILMEVERERNKNNPNYPPFPTTPLTPPQRTVPQLAPQ